VFARKPAPLQVAWLGFFASTGVTEIDYILTDRISVPEEHTEFFSEKVWYLPGTRLCMTPPVISQEILVTAPPVLRNGHITFGCYQARTKINDQVLSVWAKVLAAVPGAMLRLQIQEMHIHVLREEFLSRDAMAGIDLARVSLSSGLPWEEYLADYKNVDILLDTFPYPGGTTTAEALWMGVPTLTLMGHTMLSRQGASLLSCVDLHSWIASSEEDYVSRAIRFATDVPNLALLRSKLRDRTLASPLFDTRRFANGLQDCFEEMFLLQG
jgi:predicted O-linked N-acetylglucosamine transferase (SPINDLY family)